MIYTHQIRKAIKFAIKTHEVYQKQKRKGKDIAYISHPLTVGLILALAGASEDLIVAGILHDTIEDSVIEKRVTPKMVEERFGKKVTELVVSVTEMNKGLQWGERKARALKHIGHFSQDSVLVKSADVLSNGTELVDDYRKARKDGKDGKEVFTRFRAPALDTLANYERVTEALIKRWQESPLTGDLEKLGIEIRSIEKFFIRESEAEES